ncbi:MAG: hypothetical protein JXD22_13655 [Sedimentisphaerales bacterium]|nr:hypothetical protein [Sedimentisphaerales bacterium]
MPSSRKKVLLASFVKTTLAAKGWTFNIFFNNEYIFKNKLGDILAIPHHPTNPALVYLDDLLCHAVDLGPEFIAAARPEWDIIDTKESSQNLHFDFWLDPGQASAWDIQEFFSALSQVNRASGGLGLTLG